MVRVIATRPHQTNDALTRPQAAAHSPALLAARKKRPATVEAADLIGFPFVWSSKLDVEVQDELVGMRAQANLVRFVMTLVVKPSLDQVLGEHVAAE